MQTLVQILPFIQIALSVLLVVSVLLQQSDASLGGAFGGEDAGIIRHTRRGTEKLLFNSTIILGILFTLTAIVALLVR
jgi:preprotein translocase subunit SecG